MVVIVFMFHYMSVPKSIVGEDKSPRTKYLQHHLIGLDVCALVTINESHVEGHPQFWGFDDGISNDKLYLICNRRTLNPGTGEVFHLVVYLKGIYLTALVKSFSQTDGTISTECAHLKHVFRSHHLHQHLKQSSLQMSACHPSMQRVDIGGAIKSIEIFPLGRTMLPNVTL